MEAIRRDTPALVAEAQYRAIDILSKGDTPIKLYKMCMEAMKLYDEVATKIMEGDVEPSKLVITRRVGRDWWMYRAKGPAIYAAKAIKAREGEVVKYIVNNGRGYPVEMGYRGYDKEYYLKLLNRSKEPIKFILASSMKYIS
jgi:DNA polymerase elongation subunit (family B)